METAQITFLYGNTIWYHFGAINETIIWLIALSIIFREWAQLAGRRSLWKPAGMIMRALVSLLLFPDLVSMLIAANLLWTGYDIACAMALKQKWYFLGSTSVTDRYPILNYTAKIILFTITLILIIL